MCFLDKTKYNVLYVCMYVYMYVKTDLKNIIKPPNEVRLQANEVPYETSEPFINLMTSKQLVFNKNIEQNFCYTRNFISVGMCSTFPNIENTYNWVEYCENFQ